MESAHSIPIICVSFLKVFYKEILKTTNPYQFPLGELLIKNKNSISKEFFT